MPRFKSTALPAATLAALLLATAGISQAHEVEKGPNGGPMITTGDNHLELVTKGAEIHVFLSDKKHEPIASNGGSGRAIVQSGGKTTTITLTPAEGGRLIGKAEGSVAAGTRVVVTATVPGRPGMQGRFVVK
jgi:hypothetical protein